MKILIILATGAIITFPVDQSVKPDCFSQGYSIVKKISVYRGPEEHGKEQGWYLKGANIQVGGFYCE